MKYRRLSADELKELEQAFINFLASNTITATEWEQLKKDNPKRVNELMDIFSDMVIEKTLSNVSLIEERQAKLFRLFHFDENKITMVGIVVEGDDGGDFDFRTAQSNEALLQAFQQSKGTLKYMHAERKYHQEKNLEIFQLLEQGCRISKQSQLYQTLLSLKPS